MDTDDISLDTLNFHSAESDSPYESVDDNKSTASSSEERLEPPSGGMKLGSLPGDVLLRIAPSHASRLQMRLICRSIRQTISNLPQDWILGPNTSDETLRAVTKVSRITSG